MTEKIGPAHLERAAYIYVRQSTIQQVRHHLEGQKRQYALAERARELGFTQVVVVDDDLGVSGSGKQERTGFGRLLSAVCQSQAGAVFALEASRLARNNREWHHLIDLCAITDTLLIDGDGVYDPRMINDRLLLGLKGTMSEFELSLFKQRAREAFEQKIKAGHVLWEMPAGYIRTEDDRVEKSPDRQVQQAITLVFRKFRELGSARQTMLYIRDEQLLLPEAVRGTGGHEIVWRSPCQSRVYQILRNPFYAGSLVYGKTEGRASAPGERSTSVTRSKKPPDQWRIVLHDHHETYITWSEYLSNQKQLKANLSRSGGGCPGAARRGMALLSGLLRCGRCGRMFFVGYSGTHGQVPRYACQGGRIERGSAPCQSAGSLALDRAITELVLQAIHPAGIEAAVHLSERVVVEDGEKRGALEMALEKARYESRLAQRRFEAVDPDNRLVAAELELRWNHALQRVRDIEDRLEEHSQGTRALTALERQRLLELAADLPAVWNHAACSVELKKRILRTVIEQIVIKDEGDRREHVLSVHWKGGVHTSLRIKRQGCGHHRRVTNRDAIELVEELSKIHDDKTIALVLNRLGYRTGQGNAWRQHHISSLRYTRRLTKYERSGDWLSLQGAANLLGVSCTVVKHLIRDGCLPAKQVVACAPWIIERTDLELPDVQRRVRTTRKGSRLSPEAVEQCKIRFK